MALAAPITSLPDAIPTRQTFFSIPFTVPPPADASQAPVEVRLYVSADAGGSWTLAAKVEPKQTSFSYRAPRDGEYWFAIRTVDKKGHIRPDHSSGPELRVIVDTLPPHLELAAWHAPDGQIVVHWLSSDPLLKPESLKNRMPGRRRSDLAADRPHCDPPREPARSTYNGQASFSLECNRPDHHAAWRDQRRHRRQIYGNDGRPRFATTRVLPPVEDCRGSRARARLTRQQFSVQKQPNTSGSGSTASTGPAWPVDHVTNQTVGQAADATASGPTSAAPAVNNSNSNAAAPSNITAPSNADHGPAFGPMLSTTDSPTTAVTSPFNPPVENRFSVAGFGANSIYTQGLPAGERPYMVNSRRFAHLDYEVESSGAAGIAKIEIWGTRDAGRTWQSYGLQPATHGPIKVKVDTEGLYGFRIVVMDGKGLVTRPPAHAAICRSSGSASI